MTKPAQGAGKTPPSPWKDRLTITISAAALALSALSLYLTVFYVRDDVGVAVAELRLLGRHGGVSVLVMNNGNRPITLLSSTLQAQADKDELTKLVSIAELKPQATDAALPLMVEPGKVAILTATFMLSPGDHLQLVEGTPDAPVSFSAPAVIDTVMYDHRGRLRTARVDKIILTARGNMMGVRREIGSVARFNAP